LHYWTDPLGGTRASGGGDSAAIDKQLQMAALLPNSCRTGTGTLIASNRTADKYKAGES